MKLIRSRSKQAGPHQRRGAALVEMAVCLPVFMMTLTGIIEFGRAMSVSQLLHAAAREGCRAAIIDGSTNTSVSSLISTQAASTIGCSSSSVTVTIAVTSSANGQALSGLSVAQPRDLIAVNVSVPHSAVSYSLSRWLTGKTIRGQCSMRHE